MDKLPPGYPPNNYRVDFEVYSNSSANAEMWLSLSIYATLINKK